MPSELKQKGTWMITEVSRRVGLSQKRIRDYEKSGLVRPARQPKTNNRLYSEFDIERILRVKELIHDHGFTLACLRFFLASAPCWVVYKCENTDTCPAKKCPDQRCFEVIQELGKRGGLKDCQNCPIYLNRHTDSMPLLEKT